MNFFQAVILGLLQGFTEWLPVSSSAQVTLAGSLTEMTSQEAFSFGVFLHLGTLFAVVIRFRDPALYFTKGIGAATVLTGIVGIPLYVLITYSGEAIAAVIGVALIVTGIVLWYSKSTFGTKDRERFRVKDGSVAGAFQGFSILPGISRSGITVAALLFRGYSQEDALKISFLMSVPAIVGGVILELVTHSELFVVQIQHLLVGIFFAFLSGYAVMGALLRLAPRVRFEYFCILFGIITVVMVW